MNQCCSNLIFLSTLACKIAECLTDDELAVLAVLAIDLTALGDMLTTISTRQSICKEENEKAQ